MSACGTPGPYILLSDFSFRDSIYPTLSLGRRTVDQNENKMN